jgi:hypothetical protein
VLQAEFGYLCPVSSGAVPPSAPPLLPNQQKVSNLNNPKNNWVFGQLNPQTYYYRANSLILGGAQQCPPSAPYVSPNNSCMACQLVYDLSLKTCSSCPAGSLFNYSIHQCSYPSGLTVLRNTYPGTSNFIGAQPAFDPNLTSCPATLPFFNGSHCLPCPAPNYFDYANSLCLTCGLALTFDSANHKCVSVNGPPSPQNFNSLLGPGTQNYVGVPPPAAPSLGNCPSALPFFDGSNCISCTLPFFFNFSSNLCGACSSQLVFDAGTKQCVVNPLLVYYTSSLNGVANYLGLPPNLPPNNNRTVLGCPSSAPFSDGQRCLSCPLPNFYNFQTNHCELCPPGLVFSTLSRTCVPRTSANNSRNSNLVGAGNFMGQVPPYDPALLTCPAGSPFFDGLACITCQLPAYFDFLSLACQNCPAGTAFNAHVRLCEYSTPAFATNTSDPNIFYNGNFTAEAARLGQLQASLGIPTCPPGVPFYSSTTNLCMACPSSSPIFNLKYSQCMNCGSSGFFDLSTHICLSSFRIAPSLTRELMNTFAL